jgi:membrane fusion protein
LRLAVLRWHIKNSGAPQKNNGRHDKSRLSKPPNLTRLKVTSLFRPESLTAGSSLWLGSVRLTQPIGFVLAAAVGFAVALALGLFATFGTYTKKATVIGQLVPTGGVLRITHSASSTNAGGNLIEARVKEGDRVQAGDVLFVISGDRAIEVSGARSEAQAVIAQALKLRLDGTERDAALAKQRAQERITSLGNRVTAIDAEIASYSLDAELYAAR